MRALKSFAILFLSSASLFGCAHPGPLVETCLLDTSALDAQGKPEPAQWYGACAMKRPKPIEGQAPLPGPDVLDRPLSDMNKYVCHPYDDEKAILEWAHRR